MAAGLYYPLLGWKLTPAVAAAAMSLSSLFVVCNALRLQKLVFNTAVKTTMHTITLSVYGMMCPHCERHVAQALASIPGVSSVSADHRNNSVTLECSTTIDTDLLAATIQKAGYEYKGLL
jgi:cation transport ATPase